MKKLAVLAVMMLPLACASIDDDAPAPATVPQSAAPDPRVAELQTAMTELLDRLDVMNSRLARLEEERGGGTVVAATVAPVAEVAPPDRPFDAPNVPPAAEPVVATQEPAPIQRALASADVAESYRQAIMLFGRGKHADARTAFQAVFESEAAGDLADNALFWIGETYYATRDYTNAVRHYMRVVNEYADQNKAPDALFKIALSQEKTGDLALARKTFQQVIEKYPYSSTASSAKAELQRIRY